MRSSISQAGLELTLIAKNTPELLVLLPLPSKVWDKKPRSGGAGDGSQDFRHAGKAN